MALDDDTENFFHFVQFPEKIVQDLYEARADAIRKKDPVAYSISSHDIGELYETHAPPVMVNNEAEPVPYDPPFESILLYYEKPLENGNGKYPKASPKKTFLERYLTSLRLDYEREAEQARKNYYSQDILLKLSYCWPIYVCSRALFLQVPFYRFSAHHVSHPPTRWEKELLSKLYQRGVSSLSIPRLSIQVFLMLILLRECTL